MTMLYAAVSGVLFGLSFPPYDLHALAWIALVPLLAARPRFREGLVAGWIANLLIFSWLWRTFAAAGVSTPTTLGCWLALGFILSLYFGAFAAFHQAVGPTAWRPWACAGFWVALELVRGVALTGFPWALLGHTQAYNTALIQLAAIGGAASVSFLLVACNAAAADMLRGPTDFRAGTPPSKRARLVNALGIGALVLILFWWGDRRLERPDESTSMIRVALLQGNIDQYEKWNDAYEGKIKAVYGGLALQAAREGADLIIWPETAVPGWIPNDPRYVAWLAETVRATGRPNIVGAASRQEGKDFNAAFLVGEQGSVLASYAKQHMVPFGEYIPFGGFMKRWVPYLGQLGTFDGGDQGLIFRVGPVAASPNICYEAVFPAQIRRDADGANLIVNITNDGWFLDTGAPAQHYVTNIFRAVENGLPVVRAANTGISAIIDTRGRETVRSPLLEPGVFSGEVALPPAAPRTVFARWGHFLPWLSWLSLLALLPLRKKYTPRHVT